MTQSQLSEAAGVLVKTTCVDYPGRLAVSFFLKGCNLCCPYCYNRELVSPATSSDVKLNTIQELFDHLQKRQGIIKGLVISGGEALLNPLTPEIIKKAKSLDYKIKLDTNGTLPEKLEYFINQNELRPDFIAMDIKTSPERYATQLCPPFSKFYGDKDHFIFAIQKSIELVSQYKTEDREFRTVLVPPLVQKSDILEIAKYIPSDSSWQFAQFMPKNCLNEKYNKILTYSDSEASELVFLAKSLISGAELR